MHYALCTMHFALCTCTMRFALCTCTLHMHHMPPCTFAPWTLHLDTAHGTHTAVCTCHVGGSCFLWCIYYKNALLFASSYGSSLFRMLFWSSCLGIYARRMQLRACLPLTTVCCCTINFVVQNQMRIWRRHCAWQWTLISLVMQSNYVEFAQVGQSNMTFETYTVDHFEYKYVVIRSNQRLTAEQE